MRFALLSSLWAVLAVAAPAHKPVVAILPLQASTPEQRQLALLVEARAEAHLEASGGVTLLHLKQVLAMAGQEHLDPTSLGEADTVEQTRVLLGADRVLAVSLSESDDGLSLQGRLIDAKGATPVSVKLPRGWPQALAQGGVGLANAVLGSALVPAKAVAQPNSSSEPALKALGACWETTLKQSMGTEAPVMLSGEELEAAVASCERALAADPSLRFAQATLAVLKTISRDDAAAQKLLGTAADSDPALVPWALARFWLLTRNESNAAAVAFLGKVVAKHPSLLLFRAYLAESLASMNEHPRAVTAWREYLALAPASPFAQGRLSRSLARTDHVDEALAAARAGLELAPTSQEARLQLGSRQIDAKQLPAAIATLEPLAAAQEPSPEALLRLGWAHWLSGAPTEAVPYFKSAAEAASAPRAWKTRGIALYDLALAEARAGHTDAARAAFDKSQETGFVVTAPDPSLKALVKETPKPAVAKAGALYLSVEPLEDAGAGLAPAAREKAEALLHEKLSHLGAVFAPAHEEKKVALAFVRGHALKAYQLRVRAQPAGEGLKLDLLVLSYPELALRGMWTASATGDTRDALVEALVPYVVESASGDLDWH
jgi:tetratricopeptide (TPR) repeat protein